MLNDRRFFSNKSSIFIAAYAIYSYLYILQSSLVNVNLLFRGYSLVAICLLLLLFFSKSKVGIKQLGISFAIIVFFTITAYRTGQTNLLVAMCFIICADRVKIEKIVKVSAISTSLGVFTVVLLCLLGVVENLVYYIPRSVIQTVHCYGFKYYTGISYPLFFVSLSWLWLKKDKAKVKHIVMFQLVNIVIYHFFITRLVLYCSVIISIFELFVVRNKKATVENKIYKIVSIVGYPFFAGISIYAAYFFNRNNSWMLLFNDATNRLAQGYLGFQNYPITFFGQRISMTGMYLRTIKNENYFYIDVGYVYVLLAYGLIMFCLLIFVHTFLFKRASDENDKCTYMWLFVIMIYTAVNNSWLTISYNPIILILAPYITSLGTRISKTYRESIASNMLRR